MLMAGYPPPYPLGTIGPIITQPGPIPPLVAYPSYVGSVGPVYPPQAVTVPVPVPTPLGVAPVPFPSPPPFPRFASQPRPQSFSLGPPAGEYPAPLPIPSVPPSRRGLERGREREKDHRDGLDRGRKYDSDNSCDSSDSHNLGFPRQYRARSGRSIDDRQPRVRSPSPPPRRPASERRSASTDIYAPRPIYPSHRSLDARTPLNTVNEHRQDDLPNQPRRERAFSQ